MGGGGRPLPRFFGPFCTNKGMINMVGGCHLGEGDWWGRQWRSAKDCWKNFLWSEDWVFRNLTRWVATSYVKTSFRIGAKLILIYEDENHLAWAASIYSPWFPKDKRYTVLFEMHSTELDGSNFVIQYTSLHFRVFLNNFRQARPLCSGLDYNEDIWGCGCTPSYDYCD